LRALTAAKLRAEVLELARPAWQRLSFWITLMTAIAGALLALFSIAQRGDQELLQVLQSANAESEAAERENEVAIKIREVQLSARAVLESAAVAESKAQAATGLEGEALDERDEYMVRHDELSEERMDAVNVELDAIRAELEDIENGLRIAPEMRKHLETLQRVAPLRHDVIQSAIDRICATIPALDHPAPARSK
jgi:hypothetical protein